MENTSLLLTVMISGFSLNFGLMFLLWNYTNKRFDKNEYEMKSFREEMKVGFHDVREEMKGTKIENREEFLNLRKDIQEIRTSLNRMEGAFYSKEFCMLKDDRNKREAQ